MQHDHVLTKLKFDLLTPLSGGGLRAKYLLPSCCLCEILYFDMQNDHVLKKLKLDLLTSSQGSWGGGVGVVAHLVHVAIATDPILIIYV